MEDPSACSEAHRITENPLAYPEARRLQGSPPPKRVAGDPDVGSTSAKRPLSRGSQSQRRYSRESFSPKRGSPSPKRRRYEARDSVSPPPLHSSRASSREPSQERPNSRSSPRPASPSREEKEADEAPIPATVKAMVEFIKTNFPDAIASPAQKSSRSFDLSASVGVTDPATPSRSLLGWSQVMSDAFLDTQKKFSQRIRRVGLVIPCSLLSIDSRRSLILLPRERSSQQTLTFLTSLRTRFKTLGNCPSPSKRALHWRGL